jgi:ParB-like chromosome segregation protein Spo0J
MGLAELPVITLSGLSETQKRTLRIADNKIALNAGWDLENSARSMLMLISR